MTEVTTQQNGPHEPDAAARKRGVRRTVLWLVLLAVGIYVAFIAMSIVRGS